MSEKILTPQEVRKILNADNREIVELCRKAAIAPRKNESGQTYFSYDEVKNLRRVQKTTAVTAYPAQKQTVMVSILNSLKEIL